MSAKLSAKIGGEEPSAPSALSAANDFKGLRLTVWLTVVARHEYNRQPLTLWLTVVWAIRMQLSAILSAITL